MGLNSQIGIGLGIFTLLYIPWRIWRDGQPWKEALGTFGIMGLAVLVGAYNVYAPSELFIVVEAALLFAGLRNIGRYRERTKDERAVRVEKIRKRLLGR